MMERESLLKFFWLIETSLETFKMCFCWIWWLSLRRWYTVVIRDGHQHAGGLWCWYLGAQSMSRKAKKAMEIDCSILSCCLQKILTVLSESRSTNWDSWDQEILPYIVQFGWFLTNRSLSFSFLSRQDYPCQRLPSDNRCGLLLLLQGSMFCTFRDALLQTLVVTSGCLSNFAFLSAQSSPFFSYSW